MGKWCKQLNNSCLNEEGNICILYKNRGQNLTACQGRFCYGKIQLRGYGTRIQSEDGVEIEARIVNGALTGMETVERKRRKERKEERDETVGKGILSCRRASHLIGEKCLPLKGTNHSDMNRSHQVDEDINKAT